MTWVTITGAGVTTATKFHGDVMNKINNMFEGVDVSDSVSINAAVGWTIPTLTADLTGDLGLPQSIVTIATGALASTGETSVAVAAESGTADALVSMTGSTNDDIKFLYADTGDTITVTHQGSPSADEFVFLAAANKVLSTTVATIVVRRGTVWYEVNSITVGDALTSATLAQFASTTSAELATLLSNETGTGLVVFNSAATITQPLIDYSINAQTGTTYTPVLSDAGAVITSNNASAVTVTIPPNSSVAYPIGSSITIISIGAGLTSVTEGAGVLINSTGADPDVPVLRAQHSSATFIKTATDTWQAVGDIA